MVAPLGLMELAAHLLERLVPVVLLVLELGLGFPPQLLVLPLPVLELGLGFLFSFPESSLLFSAPVFPLSVPVLVPECLVLELERLPLLVLGLALRPVLELELEPLSHL